MGNIQRIIFSAQKPTASRCFIPNVKFFGVALIALGSVFVPELAFGQIYTFTNATSGAPNAVAANASGTSLTRGAGLGNTATCPGPNQGFSADAWPTYNYGGSNILATPNASGDYIEFTITPDPGYKLNITGFTAQLRRDNPAGSVDDGPTQVRYAYSTNGFANFTQNGATLAPGTSNLCTNAGTVRNWASFVPFYSADPVTFRIYGFVGGANATGDLHLRNVTVNGTVERISVNLSASASVSTANCGDIFDVTVQADTGFQQLTGMQFSLNWDADQFDFLSYSAVQIGGNDPAIDSTNNDNGELSYSWLGNCTTLSNGSDLLTLQFRVTGCSATDEPVNLTGTPLSLEATDCNSADIQVVVTNNALVDISSGTSVMLNCPGDQTEAAGQTQAAIDAVYRAWINSFSFSGGCFPEASFDIDTSVMPSACGDTIVATYTVTSNCDVPAPSCTATFIVTPVPQAGIIQFGGNPFTDVCVGDTAVFRAAVPNSGAPAVPVQTYAWTLSGSPVVTPAGGQGADGVTFRRQEAIYGAGDAGAQTVNLVVTYTNGCVETAAQHTITVHALPVMTCPANTSVCVNATVVDLTTLTPTPAPAPGVFSGPGVSGNNFDPNGAGIGTHTIWYTHTNGNGCTDSCSFTITVEPTPSATVQYNSAPEGNCASGETVCSNETTDVSFSLSNGDELIVTEIRHEYASNDGDVCALGDAAGYGLVTGSAIQVGDDVSSGITEFFVNDSTENVRITFVLEPRSSTGAECAGTAVTVNLVIEPMPRLANCLPDTTLQTGEETPDDCLAEYIWDHPTTTGGCPPVTLVMQIDGGTPVTVIPGDPTVEEFNKGVHTVLYTATDSQGNEDTCSFTVTVQDNEPPTITCPAGSPFARNTNTGVCTYTVQGTEFNATFVENCPGATLTNSFNNSSSLANAILPKGPTTITWTVTDGMGMSSTNCQITVNVTDNQTPTITCPAGSPFARNTDAGQCNYTVQGTEFNPTFGDNCPGAVISNNFNNTNSLANADLPKGPTTIVWTVTDGMGMSSATCAIVVNVTDNQMPTITCAAGSPFARNADAGQCTYTVSGVEFDPVVFDDNCPGETISNNFNNMNTLSGAQLPGGANTIVWTVTDGMGMSSASCSIVVNVIDTDPPVITCPNPVTTECNRTDTLYTGVPTVASDCNVTFTFANGAPTGGFPCNYSFVRTFTATDASNNTTSCTQVISVRDIQAPVFTVCPANTTVECGASTEPMATGLPTILDSCDASPVLSVHSDITVETPGPCNERVITRTWYAVDHCFNSRACVQTITVDDTTPPTLTCPASLTIECGTDTIPGPTAPTGQATATDNCGPVTVTYNGAHLPVMNNCPDVRLIFRTWTATDACGNVNTCSVQNIIIRDTQAPTLTNAASNLTVECDGAGNTTALNAWLANNGGATASDVCAGVTWSNNFTALSDGCGATGSSMVTFTATDGCGHTTASVATFTILDNAVPTITCPVANLTLECDGNYLSEIADWVGTATASDVCDATPAVSTDWNGMDVPALNCGLTSGLTIKFTATDACGKTATCSRMVYVDDTVVPTITCPVADLTLECDGNYISEIAVWAATATASDACDATPTITDNWNDVDVPALSCNLSSGLTITFTATDDCNNSATCSRTVYVDDTALPTMTCPPANLTLECDGNYISEIAAWVATASASDACDATPTITDNWNDVDVPALSCNLSAGLTITFTATDDCNNTASCSRTVFVDDTAAPTMTCPPANLTLECDGNYITEIAAWVATATASDVCDATPTITDNWNDVDVPALSCNLSAGLTITFTATDDCNNTASCSRTVYIDDTVSPAITCPADTVINCEISSLPAVTGMATASDNCDAMPMVSFSDGTPVVNTNCADSVSFVRTWLAVDACGNQSSCFQTITKRDTTDPVITCPGDVLVSCENPHTPAQTGSATATDNCDANLIVFHTDQATVGQCPQDSVISRRWIAVDNCGNLDICIQTITVRDLTPPVPVCPANTTIACNADTSAVAVGLPTVTDNCDMTPTVFHSNVITPGGLCAQTYTITRTWTAVDDCGNSSNCSQSILVRDIVAPVLVCAPNVTVECSDNLTPGPLGPNHPTGIAVAADNCDITPTVLLDNEVILSGTCPQEDTIRRTWVAIDDCTNGTACVQTIVVRDRTAPTWSTAAGNLDRTLECSDATGIAAAQSLAPVASDNCDNNVTNIVKSPGAFVPGTQCPQAGTYTNTWIVTDDCGNTSSIFTQIISITDTTRPVVIAPNGIDIECSTALPAAAVTIAEYLALPGASASDNCTMTANLVVSSSTGAFTGTQCNGSIIRTYTITDQCGNSRSVTQTITVTDNTIPVITCPANVTINCEASQLPANTGTATASDNCDTAPVVSSSNNTIPGNCPNNYTIQRTWTAIDACQNSTSCVQTIAVQDTTRPVLTCPADVTVNCDASTLPANTGTATAQDNCNPAPTVSSSDAAPVPGACANAQSIARTWMAVDACGNSANTCVQIITVQDTTKPVITCPAGTTVNCENTTPAIAGTATASDNCDPMPVITHSDQSTQTNTGACTDQTYTITRTWKATDACNNMGTCAQIIFVQDTTRPTMICPLNITINCEVDTIPTNTGQPIVQDNCDLTPGVNHLDIVTPGNCPDKFLIRRRWVAVDNCGNATLCEQMITVQDTTKPVLTIPADVTLDCHVNLLPSGQAGVATATDNCTDNPVPTFADNITPGSCAQSYTITRTWSVVDACGNSTSGLQTIFVRDITMPTIQCPANQTIECNANTDPNVNTALGKAIAIDNCDPMPAISFVDAKSQFGACIRDTIITRTWTALDNCNNLAICQQTITKKDTQAPVLTCPADTVINCDASLSPASIGFATASDNCGVASTPVFSDAAPVIGQCPQQQVIIRTWSSTDDCGHTGTCSQRIAVQDTTRPVVIAPNGIDIECSTALPAAAVTIAEYLALPGASASDNCTMTANLVVSSSTGAFTGTQCNGSIIRTYTITDQCGNSRSVTQTITVTDNTIPVITCPANVTINCEASQLPANTGTATASDNCDTAPVVSSSNNTIPGNCPNNHTIQRTWTAIDACQNSTSCVQTIAVQDTTRPVLTCPANVTVNCDASTLPANTGTATAQDNCNPAPTVSSSDAAPVPGACANAQSIARTWMAVDACGNSAITCVQIITVQDTTRPVITCPTGTTVNCENTTPAIAGTATATDNCDPMPVIMHNDQSTQTNTGACTDQTYTITRIWKATDACNNVATCQQIIFVQDTTRPAMICPLNITINCDVDTIPTNTGQPIVQDNCDVTPGVTHLDIVTPGNCPDRFVIRRRWIAVDNCANINACEHFITVQDTTKPVLTIPMDVTLDCHVNLLPSGQAGVATATDNCTDNPVPTFADNITPGSCAQSYTITRTWTVVDACGNSTSGLQTIFVQDISAPAIQCPADQTIECNASTDPNVNTALGKAIAIDNCDPMPIVTFIDAKNQFGPCIRDTIITRTWGVLDNCNNAAACQQTITKKDTQAPVLTCPADTVINCDASLSPASIGFATASDNCGVASMPVFSDAAPVIGQCPQQQVIIRTWSSTDDCGHTGTCSQRIAVQDTTRPVVLAPNGIDIECSTALPAAAVTIAEYLALPGASASDNCTMTANLFVSSSTGAFTGTQCNGSIIRTYTITDQCGNSTSVTQTITVTDNTAPGITCPANVTINCEASQLPANTGAATASDNCDTAPVVSSSSNTIPGNCPNNYIIQRTWTAIDACQNSTSCVQTIAVQDTTRPVLTCPADVTVNCDASTLPANTGTATAQDNCNPAPTVSSSDAAPVPGACANAQTIARTWMAVDACGNSAITCVQIITVQDTTRPVITCPANATVNCDNITPGIAGTATATDNCGTPTVNFSDSSTPGNCPDARTIARTWKATDACNNMATCVQTITVQDTTKPVIICPLNITINCEVAAIPTNTGTAIASDNCDTSVSVTSIDTPVPGSCPQERVISRRWIAVDNCLNATACIQTITVQDTTRPALTCPAGVTLECNADLTPAGQAGMPTVLDNCDATPTVNFANASTQTANGTCSDFTYTITRTWTATDDCGNSSTCVQTIAVEDTTPPVIACPNPISVECDKDLTPGSNATGTAIAIDNCDTGADVVFVNDVQTPSGICSQEYKIERTWTAIDACGNPSACVQIIFVVDDTPPAINCVAALTVECGSDTSAAAIGIPSATDNCGTATSPTHSNVVQAGNCPQEYVITRTWTSTDNCGNVGTCVQTITVDDSMVPVITCPAGITVECDESTDPMDTGVATATDNCDMSPAIDYDDASTQATVESCEFYTYTITRTWTATDACGNSETCVQIIEVADTEAPMITCPPTDTVNCEDGQGVIPAMTGTPTTSDNCDPATSSILITVNGVPDMDCPQMVTYTLTWFTQDYCLNSATCQQIVVAQDTTRPVITCPTDITVECDQPTTPTATGTATAQDNCDTAPVIDSFDGTDPGNCPANYTILRTWRATDACDNETTCLQTISVQDTTEPELLDCPPIDITVECGQDESPMATGVPVASDNCDPGVSYDYDDVVETTGLQCPLKRRITRTWTITDDCGNSLTSVCLQTILVFDNTAPLIACPADITVNCDDPTHPDSLNLFAVAIDACDLNPTVVWDDEGSTAPCMNDTLSAIVRTWFAFDVCGNVSVCDQVIALVDNLAPAITCPQDTVVNCEVNPIPANTGAPTVSDNCDAAPVVTVLSDNTVQDPDCPQAKTISRTFQVADHCGNSSTCLQIIAIQDTTRPVIICPNNITIECDESTAPSNTGSALASDNCDQSPVITHTNLPATPLGGCSFNRKFVRVWLAGDACDNGSLCQQTITILDTEGPLVSCPASVTIECGSDTTAIALGFATASDNCGTATTPTRSDAVTLGNCPQEYTIARTWSSTDDCGNVGTCVQTISVDDSMAPTFTEPADITIYADANCGYDSGTTVTGDATGEADNCASGLDATFSDATADGQCAGHKIITRTWSLNDGCGNITTHDQIITVLDTLSPIFPKPDDVTLTTDAGATCPATADISLVISQSTPVATGNVAFTFTVHGITQDGPTVYGDNCSFGDSLKLFVWSIDEDFDGNADSCYRLIRVLWRVYDDCGNFQQRQQQFTILENKAPEITFCPPSLTVNCEDSTLPAATGQATASDNCDPMPVVTYADVDDPGACPQEKTIARTWTVTDNCGNSTQCSQTITVVDDEAPTLVCPPNTTVSCDDPSPVAAGMATATDNCDAMPTIDFDDQSTQTNLGLCSDQTYSIIRTWTAYDDCGNQAISCTQSISVRDVVAPVITCPSNKTVSCEESLNPAVNTALGTAISVDNCDPNPGVTFTDFPTQGNCPNERSILRTWLTVDNCNNPAACTQTITVVDDTPPAITCPKDTVINCEIDPTVNITGLATATDNCDTAPVITHSDASTTGVCPVIKTIARTWMAVDACGNSTICVQTITMQDTTRPVITCPANVTIQCNESPDPILNPNVGTPMLSDNCDQMLASNKIDVPLPPNGCTQVILRNWITADDCNNAAACTQTVTITDSKAPTLVGVPDMTLQCGDAVPPVGSPTVSDNCDTNPTMNYIGQDSIPGQCPNSYAIQRSWALGDACGNSTVFVQTITVQDTQAPTWTNTPADVTVECDAIPAIATPTATDVCDNEVTVTYGGETRSDGECGDFYTLTRTWTATDNCNNSTVHTQTISVQDTTPPTWESSLPADMTVECGQVPSPATLVAEDNCDNSVEVTYGESSVEAACPVVKIITRTWVAYDNCSNSTLHTQTITVTDTTPPVALCQNITVELNQNGSATIADNAVNNGSNDNCGSVAFSTSKTTFNCGDLGTKIVVLTVTDGCGLTATCSASVLVRDLIPPVWVTQPGTLDRTVECGDAAGLAAAQSLAPVATDNCGPVTPVKSAGAFVPGTACPPVGTYTNTWTVADASGNSTSVFMQTITITDTTKPLLTCPANLTLECDDEEKAVKILDWLTSASATDNCGGTLVYDNDYDGDSIPPVSCDLSQGLSVHFTVSDNCGNTAACSASIYVLDTEGPTINGDCALLDQYGNASNAAAYIVGTSAGAVCPASANVNLQAGQEISDDYTITAGGVPVPGILGCLADNCTAAENLIARVVSVTKEGDACIAEFEIRMVVRDACGNQSADTLTYFIEVADNTAPTFTKPADITVYLDENCDVDLSGIGDVTDEQDNCQTGLNATYTDVEIPAQGVSEYIIERTWTLTDGCGNTASAQVQYITVLDTIKPDFGCPGSIEVAPNSAGCTWVVEGNSLDPDDPTDNCGTILIAYDLSGATDSTGTGSLDGMAFNEGTTVVVWTVSDGNGNSVACSFTVVVTQCIQISGTLIWEGNDNDTEGVAQAMVALSGDGTDTDGPTTADGKYTLISGSGGNFVVTPTKTSPPADPLNGVSTLDALLVQQYIVGMYTFPDGYKMIAADVNMSNAITTLDASLIRQAILGSPGALPYFLNKPWRFVPTKANTPYSTGYDPGSNPFASPIPSTRVLTAVTADAIGEDFYGIKTGDVNATGNPQNKPENLEPLRLRIQDRTLESGQNIFVPVRMSAFDQLAGFQMAFDFNTDVLELISVEPITSPLGLTPAGHFGLYKAAEGEIRSAWIDPYGKTIAEEMPVFALRFVVKQSGAKLSEVFGMKPKAISAEAYNMDYEVSGVELEFYEEQTTSTFDPLISDVPGMTLQQNRPNPFTDRTLIGFSLDQGCDAQLRILDASGRELYRIDNYYPAGKHEEVIYLRDLRATGVLYYQLRTPYGTLTRKMTALAP